MIGLFKKKTREQQLEKRVESVFAELISDSEFEFTDLEIVMIANSVRHKLSEHLNAKKGYFMEQSVISNQKAIEIKNSIELLE